MARLIDDLMRSSLLGRLTPGTRDDLLDAPVFAIDNVAAYYFSQDEPVGSNALDDLPSIAPPYPVSFFETRAPLAWIFAKETVPWPLYDRWGFLARGRDWYPDTPCDVFVSYPPLVGVRWVLELTMFVELSHQYEMLARGAYFLDGNGHVLSLGLDNDGDRQIAARWEIHNPHGVIPQFMRERGVNPFPQGDRETYTSVITSLTRPALLALSFLHCKNVTVTQQRPPDWQQKAAQKKHGRPLVTYHVLNIEPMKTVLRTEGDIEHNGLKKALHICRGHFKTFTPDKPLFGKVTGTYWWQPHVRGSAEVGVTLKDYNVKTPKAPQSE